MQRPQQALILRRDDHKRDAIGAVFLGAISDEAQIRAAVARYLGPVVQVRSIQVEQAALRVEVECSRFPIESQNLARLGKSLAGRGRMRGAADTFAEALKLDPLNAEALKGRAGLHALAGEMTEAEDCWVRAGEIRGYDGEILRGLASVALSEDRRPTAIQYLEEALLVNPNDSESRAILDDLRRQIELRFRDGTAPPNRGSSPKE